MRDLLAIMKLQFKISIKHFAKKSVNLKKRNLPIPPDELQNLKLIKE